MRIVSILIAVAVVAGLYVLVFERDAIASLSNGAPIEEAIQVAQQDAPSEPDQAAEPTQEPKSTVIKVVALATQAQEIDSAVILRGETKASRQVEVRAETSGQVVSSPLPKGTSVTQGDILCELDLGTRPSSLANAKAALAEAKARIPETQARLEEAKSRLDEAIINFNAAEKLAQGGYASESRVASAQAAVRAAEAGVASAQAGFESTEARIQSAEAAVEAAETEISRVTITAPFSGVLESDTAETGSLLQPGALCGTVIQLDPIKLVGYIPETELTRVKRGAPAQARLIDGTIVQGQVSFLSRAADSRTRTFQLEIDIPNPEMAISDGQTAEIVIASDGKFAHLLPQSALTLDNDGRLGVRVIQDDNTSKFVSTEVLRDTVEGVWLAGLDTNASVIVVGQEYVSDGVPVEPTYREVSQ